MINTKEIARLLFERYRSGESRLPTEAVKDWTNHIGLNEARKAIEQGILKSLRSLLRSCADINSKKEEVLDTSLPFSPDDPTRRYRTGPLVMVRREGQEVGLRPEKVTGTEINRFDAVDRRQKRQRLAYAVDRQTHNKAVTLNLMHDGLDPKARTNEQMTVDIDQRICALCGEGPIVGDSFERDHEQPVSTLKPGESTTVRWAHRSCNRSKGKIRMEHLHT